jgi:hypothetical protein
MDVQKILGVDMHIFDTALNDMILQNVHTKFAPQSVHPLPDYGNLSLR